MSNCWNLQNQANNRTQVSQADLIGASSGSSGLPNSGSFGGRGSVYGPAEDSQYLQAPSGASLPGSGSNSGASAAPSFDAWGGSTPASLVPSRPTPSMTYFDQGLINPQPSQNFTPPTFFERLFGSANPSSPAQLRAPINPALLPPTLINPCRTPSYNPYNPKASLAIAAETAKLQNAIERCVFVDSKYPVAPFLKQPREGREFQEMHSIPFSSLPSPFDGSNTVIGSFRVPYGFDGVLNRIICGFFNGSGFVDGSGDIVWRVRINSVYARNLGEILYQYGSLQNAPFIIPGYGIKLVSGQTVTFYVSVPASSPIAGANSRIMLSGFGWYWPRK